jgi:hypothetical protein
MKTITLLAVSLLLTTSVTLAQEGRNANNHCATMQFNSNEPIVFNERGIEFFVFPNGDFDFNTRSNDSFGDYYFKSAGKRGTKDVVARNPVNYGVVIEHDSFGRVRRVGNTFINYDAFDRVKRIGTVYMRYNRFALTQIGGMTLVYNRFGDLVDVFGSVKGRRNQGFTSSYYGTADNYYNDYAFNDNDYYYYKADGTKAKVEDKK